MARKKYKYQKYFTYDDHRYVVRADTPEELAVKEYKKRQELEGYVKTIGREMLVKDWIKEWMETYKEPSVSPESYTVYQSNIKRHILPAIGNMKVKAVKPAHCQKLLNEMKKKKMSASYLRRVRILLNEIFREAEQNGLTLNNPAERLTIPTGTVRESRALTEYEEAMCRELAESHPFGIVAKLMLDCGLRIGEAAALRWCDVNFQKNIISVKHTIKRNADSLGPPKTKAGIRNVPIPAGLASYLKSIRGEPFDFVVNNDSEHLHKSRLYGLWRSYVNDLNILMGCGVDKNGKAIPPYRAATDLRPHYFRHTYCTHLQDAGVPINIARQFMGHSSILVTQKIYTHETDHSFESARRMIENLQNGVATTSATTD